jgi:tetratricopeptide (TPR) repeat protein
MTKQESPQPKETSIHAGDITKSEGVAIGDGAQATVVERLFHTVIHLVIPPWVLAILALSLILAFIMASSISNISVLRDLLPTPLVFPTAHPDESLIIVADFDDRSGERFKDIDPAQYIYEQLVTQAKSDGLDVRIERLREMVDDNAVRPTGETYGATLVLWGWCDALTITLRWERIKTPEVQISITPEVQTSAEQGWRLSLSDPKKIESRITTELPRWASYFTFFTLGLYESAKLDYEQALVYLTSAVNSVQKESEGSTILSEAYLHRGLIFVALGNFQGALADYALALELNPEYTVAYDNRGLVHLQMGDYKSAIEQFRRAIETDPCFASAYGHLGVVDFIQQRYEDAVPNFEKAISAGSTSPEYYFELGLSYIYSYTNASQGYTKEDLAKGCELGVPWLDKALEHDPYCNPCWQGIDVCEGVGQ